MSLKSQSVCHEQKSLTWMKDNVTVISKAGQVVMNLCSGTLTISKVFMVLSKHWPSLQVILIQYASTLHFR